MKAIESYRQDTAAVCRDTKEKPLFVFNFMDFVFIARDHMRMYLMTTRPWICISTTKKACERSLVADDEEKIAEFRPNLLKF